MLKINFIIKWFISLCLPSEKILSALLICIDSTLQYCENISTDLKLKQGVAQLGNLNYFITNNSP